jgi:hypothetical protein
MEGPSVRVHVGFKFLLDLTGEPDEISRVLGQAQGRWCGAQLFTVSDKQLRVQFIGKIVQLEAHSARREAYLFRRTSHAR